MNSKYLPKKLYDALQENPSLSIPEIQEIMECSPATAYRHRSAFKEFTENKNKYPIHDEYNRVYIKDWKLINNQKNDLEKLIISILNNTGFKSTKELRDLFYKNHPKYKHQTNRNFNRYFEIIRDKLNKDKHKLEIYRSSNNKTGFCTRQNAAFKPTDN